MNRVISPGIYNVSNDFMVIGSLASLDGPLVTNALLLSKSHPPAFHHMAHTCNSCLSWSNDSS